MSVSRCTLSAFLIDYNVLAYGVHDGGVSVYGGVGLTAGRGLSSPGCRVGSIVQRWSQRERTFLWS